MDLLKAIERLAYLARQEEVPVSSVADRVLGQIRTEDTATFSFIPFDLFAGISAIAASVVAFVSFNAWRFVTSPLTQFLAPLQEVRLW